MRVLAVGIATLDVISHVERFPLEDEEMRALARRQVRGGNATNTLVVLSQLGHRGAWAGTLAEDGESRIILADLEHHGIDVRHVVRYPEGQTPTSYICLSQATGSRTIVHYRDLPEYRAEDFDRIDLDEFGWIHFEGRAPEETRRMLDRLQAVRGAPRCSLEVEKPRAGIETLFQGPEVLLFSRAYARSQGVDDARRFLLAQQRSSSARYVFAAWGDQGAYALERGGEVVFAPAWPVQEVVDTVAAGDVFNAAVIDGLAQGRATADVLHYACRLAGESCAREGLAGLGGGERGRDA